jgi:hypothetical protein
VNPDVPAIVNVAVPLLVTPLKMPSSNSVAWLVVLVVPLLMANVVEQIYEARLVPVVRSTGATLSTGAAFQPEEDV